MTLPGKEIRLKGILLQKNKEILGRPGSSLLVQKEPIILRPSFSYRKSIQGIKSGKRIGGPPNFVFRNICFNVKDSEFLFVFQNQNCPIHVLFEDCFFYNQKYSFIRHRRYLQSTKGSMRQGTVGSYIIFQ